MQGENTGASGPTVVEPGSAGDPFTQPATDQAAAAEQAVREADKAEGAQGQPATETPTEPAKEPDPVQLTALNDLIQSRVGQVQTGLDRRINTLEKQATALSEQLTAAQRQTTEAERKGKTEGLSEEETALLTAGWSVEDARSEMETQRRALDEYRGAVNAYAAMTKYGHLGLTEEMFEGKSAEEIDGMMDAFEVLATAKGDQKAPAGATAASDVGGAPPAPEPFKLGTEQGVSAMAANVKALFGQPGSII